MPVLTESEWGTYQWNPPQYLVERYPDPDPDASPKPTWAEIVTARDAALPIQLREQLTQSVNAEEERRICAAYLDDLPVLQTVQNEILYRLRATTADLAAKNTERDRLHFRAVALVAGLDTMTLEELQAFDPAQDIHWAPAQG